MDKMENVTDIPQITCEGKAESSCKVKRGKQQGKVWSSSFLQVQQFHTLRECEILNVHLNQTPTMPRDNMSKAPYMDLLALWGKSNWETLSTLLMMVVSSSQETVLNGLHKESGGFLLMKEDRSEDITQITHSTPPQPRAVTRTHTVHSQLIALSLHVPCQPLKHCFHTSSFREVFLIVSLISIPFPPG